MSGEGFGPDCPIRQSVHDFRALCGSAENSPNASGFPTKQGDRRGSDSDVIADSSSILSAENRAGALLGVQLNPFCPNQADRDDSCHRSVKCLWTDIAHPVLLSFGLSPELAEVLETVKCQDSSILIKASAYNIANPTASFLIRIRNDQQFELFGLPGVNTKQSLGR